MPPVMTRTVPIAPEIAPQLVSFAPVKKAFVMHNAKAKSSTTMFNGNMMTVPAIHEVHPTKYETDADGDPIPGTYVVEDIYSYDPNQQAEVLTMDAERAVKVILGIIKRPDGAGAEAASNHALTGLSLLPRHPTKEMWQGVAKSGEHRAFLASVKHAQYELEAHDLRNALRKEAGMAPVTPGPVVQHAIALINQFNALVKDESDETLAPYREQEEAQSATADLKFQVYLKTRIMKLAEEAASELGLDKKKTFDKLMQDPEVRKHAQREYRMRKKGHLPISDEDLDAAAELGQSVDEAEIE